ncbi:vWA domain-containing protein [Solicola sp. PLA-1-18]|uniref:vWA domain-containing protein n=1 Tax=Solicola sp. PLA-1-18 TaxID=3380532 RepID=UPI003B76CF08
MIDDGAAGNDADEVLVAFCHALRAAAVDVTLDRTQSFLTAVACVGAGDREAVYWAGRATLLAGPDDLRAYDRAFDTWFADEHPRTRPSRPAPRVVQQADLGDSEAEGESDGDDRTVAMIASDEDALKHRDVATLSTAERKRLARMFARLEVHPPTRRSPRRGPHRRGDVDPSRTLRDQLRRGGEPGPLKHRRRRTRPRRVVLLIDVSGSMEPYADSLLRLAHQMVAAAPRSTEVFTLGTRLTRVTGAMRLRDPERALAAAGEVVPDWSGGTRLGEVLGAFVDRWGQRGMARGAVVVIASDGWERGDPELLGRQVQRLQRLGHRVVWSNPHRGKVGYAPVQGGIAAALPFVDAFVAGHSMAAFAAVAEVVGRD